MMRSTDSGNFDLHRKNEQARNEKTITYQHEDLLGSESK